MKKTILSSIAALSLLTISDPSHGGACMSKAVETADEWDGQKDGKIFGVNVAGLEETVKKLETMLIDQQDIVRGLMDRIDGKKDGKVFGIDLSAIETTALALKASADKLPEINNQTSDIEQIKLTFKDQEFKTEDLQKLKDLFDMGKNALDRLMQGV